MRINNKKITVLYRTLFLVLCSYGLALNLGITKGQFNTNILWFYTILSNLACLIYILMCQVKTINLWNSTDAFSTTAFPRFKGAITLCITVTFLIYHFLLVPNAFAMDPEFSIYSLSNILVHYVIPIMIILDWLLFDVKGRVQIFDPLMWLSLPLIYFVVMTLRGKIVGTILIAESKYPYFFMDFDVLGFWVVLRNVGVLIVFFILLGYLVKFIDSLLGRNTPDPVNYN